MLERVREERRLSVQIYGRAISVCTKARKRLEKGSFLRRARWMKPSFGLTLPGSSS